MAPPQLLANKVAVITGAASTVGKVIAQKFFDHGASVFLADKNLDRCQSIAKDLEKNKDPNNATTQVAAAMPCDTSDWVKFGHEIENLKDEHRHLDIFYNNTEFDHVSLSDSKAFENTMAANFQSVLESINLASAVMTCQKHKDDQLEHMIKNYMTRTAATADVANAAVFLASDYGKSLTGNKLVLNGKFTTP